MNIHFKKLAPKQVDTIFGWLTEPHIQEFWDNSQAHKDDIINFIEGRKTPSNYASGQYVYWLASLGNEPFAMLMTIRETCSSSINQEKLDRLSRTGNTYNLEYMIGNPDFFGKGYGAQTLFEFIDFFRKNIDPKADTFLIDPDCNNPRAKHIYMKAGFEHVCDFMMEGNCSGTGKLHHLLVKKFEPKISIVTATMEDYPTVQNLARFYVYDRSGFMQWGCEENGNFECIDFKHYFEQSDHKAFIVRVHGELAGFVLLDKEILSTPVDYNMGEFFIIAKFQGTNIATIVASKIFASHKGKWSVAVMPESIKAAKFWHKIIARITNNKFEQSYRPAQNENEYNMTLYHFDNSRIQERQANHSIRIRNTILADIDAMVLLSKAKRLEYEKAQPQFWRYAGEAGDNSQREWFKELLDHKDYLMFTAENEHQGILGFIIGKLMPAPEVYNLGGLTLMIDDFCVESENLWETVGEQLINIIKVDTKTKDVAQILVVCGAHDHAKRKFLMDQNLSIASEWFVGGIV